MAQETIPTLKNTELNLTEKTISTIDKGFLLSVNGNPSEGLEMGAEALESSLKLSNDSLVARSYNTIAVSFYKLKNYNDALSNVKEAKKIFKRINKHNKVITCNHYIGIFYREFGRIDSSNVYFGRAIELSQKIKNNGQQAKLYHHLGHNYSYYIKDYKKAIDFLNKSISLSQYAEDKSVKVESYEVLGDTYSRMNNQELAHFYYDKSIQHAKSNNYLKILFDVYQSKIDLYAEQNNHKKVNSTLKKLLKIKDSIRRFNRDNQKKDIEARYQIKENKTKLEFIENEKAAQEELLKKSKIYNLFSIILIAILILIACWVYTKNKDLRLAKKRAEKLSQVKSSFYSEISHELRTPLYAVIELSSILLKENVNAKHKEYLKSLKFSGNHLLSLVNNVLQLNNVDSREIKLQESNFNLKVLITNIIDSLEFALSDSGNKIILNYDYNIPKVLIGDSLKLSQIFINLISNSIKFTNKGTIEIIIKEVKALSNNDETRIFFSVRDEGIGIPKEKQDKVFEDFYQELAKNENSYKGTGLGLSIVKKIIDAMDSTIQLESEEGKGTTFFFEASFKKQNSLDDIGDVVSKDELAVIGGYRILIVDDNKINRLVTKKVLDQIKVQSYVVKSGKEAIELVKNQKFDCILMDIHMPGLDGYETSKIIREFNRDITILALTAASSEEVEKNINNYEMDGYILKPFILSELITTITQSVSKNDRFIA